MRLYGGWLLGRRSGAWAQPRRPVTQIAAGRETADNACRCSGGVVSLDQLAALDLLLWLTGSQRAARMERTNQSTIVRRSQAVETCFGVTIQRDPNGWRVTGDNQLLRMERQLHQQARLLGHRPLRLHAPFWTLQNGLRRLPPGWCTNPATAMAVCENPIELLRAHVIDAALLTPTQMPPERDDLACVELYASPIQLTVLAESRLSDPLGTYQALRERGALVMRQPSFLPRSCLLRCQEWFGELMPASDAAEFPAHTNGHGKPASQPAALSVAFLTPEMRQVQGLPFAIDAAAGARPYVERLVVRAELASEPAFLRLRQHLASQLGCGDAQPQALLRSA